MSAFLVFVASFAAAGTAKISGTVVDQKGVPVPHIVVEATPLDMGTSGGLPQSRTDDDGHFVLVVVTGRTPDGHLYGQRWAVYPHQEGDYYADLSSTFYETAKSQAQHVQLTQERPEANVEIRIGPRAGVLTGHVTDSLSGAILTPYFEFTRASDSSKRMGIRMGDPYRILLPSNTDINFVVQMEGYGPWTYPGVVNVGPGQDLTLDIKLEPLSRTR